MTQVAKNGRCRIVLTGGPGAGKTTAADLFRREIGERVVVVPEAATLLFSGGFPDAVIFFESAAVGGMGVEGGNRVRIESNEEAVHLDRRLRVIWSKHPRFVVVRHNPSFFRKITFGLTALESIVADVLQRGD